MNRYNDILHKERPVSNRPKMDLGNRAKIFAPFAALRGFDMAVLTKAKERALMPRAELSDDMQLVLEDKLRRLSAGDSVTVTYFSLQKRIGDYEVGSYVTETGWVEAVDVESQALVLTDAFIPFMDIYDLQGEVFEHGETEGEP